ncbi:MAG: hypothetical protein AUG51_08840 [Acidobacteria bacterium 13_1_20CM_3_53_8]|nr:MAG: hypothetical protein AUG51_08840 [Acidobacteria bacterium 13_1_20CM_3_53_8]
MFFENGPRSAGEKFEDSGARKPLRPNWWGRTYPTDRLHVTLSNDVCPEQTMKIFKKKARILRIFQVCCEREEKVKEWYA